MGMALADERTTKKRPNPHMDLTVTNAAQRVLQPRCLLMVPAAHAHVGQPDKNQGK